MFQHLLLEGMGKRKKVKEVVLCLELQEFKNIKNMGGGYAAWVEKGFTVEKPKI